MLTGVMCKLQHWDFQATELVREAIDDGANLRL